MKNIFSVFLIVISVHTSLFAQQQYEVLIEKSGEKILKGIISRESLQTDSSFKWYAANQKYYQPEATSTAALKQHGDSIQLLIFMGTWCEDSHFIIPKFFSLLDAASFSPNRTTLIAVDRTKKTLGHLAEALNVKNVPCIIVMKNGKELGRVIEYGKTGHWDKELGQVIEGKSN